MLEETTSKDEKGLESVGDANRGGNSMDSLSLDSENNTHDNKLSDISKHAEYAITQYYSKPYTEKDKDERTDSDSEPETEIDPSKHVARVFHSGVHACRASIISKSLANLYEAKLSPENLDLLQIATLFHDTGRQGDGDDIWDAKSAENCYIYLTNALNIERAKALRLVEAVVNKDAGTAAPKYLYNPSNADALKRYTHHTRVNVNEDGSLDFKADKINPNYRRNILQKIIHDSDSLDICRVRKFDIKYLELYQDFKENGDEIKLQDLEKLVASHIEMVGNVFRDWNTFCKCENASKLGNGTTYGAVLSECLKYGIYRELYNGPNITFEKRINRTFEGDNQPKKTGILERTSTDERTFGS